MSEVPLQALCTYAVFCIRDTPVAARTPPVRSFLTSGACEDRGLDGPASEDKGPYALDPNTVELIPTLGRGH